MNEIYLALDFPTWDEANLFLQTNELAEVPVKVGMELFFREGPTVIKELKKRNHPVFLDLKLHDIPTTVERAVKNIARLGVDYVNVHALGGKEMIKRAKDALVSSTPSAAETKLLAVTILTSFTEQALQDELRIGGSVENNVAHLASLAKGSGADGVVCSVHEVEHIHEKCGPSFITMTPGIRLSDSSHDDQQRVATPAVAKQNGATSIVIGRSITKAKDPKKAYEQAKEEWKHGTGV